MLLFTALGNVKDALLVFSGVPLALTGGIAALWLREIDFHYDGSRLYRAVRHRRLKRFGDDLINNLRQSGTPSRRPFSAARLPACVPCS
jgi:hypothetical protein